MNIGRHVKQPSGYHAFIPGTFPPNEALPLDDVTHRLHAGAALSLGKLDGITQLLPNIDFFIFMYVRKEAALSSQIEGTRATMIDVIRAEAEITQNLPNDVDDIQHYIAALNYGLKRLESFPLSLRLIREVHRVLMKDGRTSHIADPGEFRRTQNWIGGASPQSAHFVPPPVENMKEALSDFEKFLHSDSDMLPLIKTALAHAQFETIHPFLDGNGRTGRLLVTFYLCQQGLLERPVLYLSEYFKKHRELYFDLLDRYHRKGDVLPWIKFFLEGITTVSAEAIETSKKVTKLRERDMVRVQELGRSAEKGTRVLEELYKLPIVNVNKIAEWTGLSRVNANNLAAKMVKVGILVQQDKEIQYARTFEYRAYLSLFSSEGGTRVSTVRRTRARRWHQTS